MRKASGRAALAPAKGTPRPDENSGQGKSPPMPEQERPCSTRPAVCSTPVPARWNTQHVESKGVFKFVPLFHLKTTLLCIFRMAGKSPGACSPGRFCFFRFHWPETCGKHQEGPLLPRQGDAPGQTRTADRGKARPCWNRNALIYFI